MSLNKEWKNNVKFTLSVGITLHEQFTINIEQEKEKEKINDTKYNIVNIVTDEPVHFPIIPAQIQT